MELDFAKGDGLVPAIVQDSRTRQVLMLGYMNAEALKKTQAEGKVTFFSRSKQRLWTKGETSGNFLLVRELHVDCDKDTLLILAEPRGPVCHTGNATCFATDQPPKNGFLSGLEAKIATRSQASASESYTAQLFEKGINKIAQKVGEEAVEVVIEAMANNEDLLLNESADLLYHLIVLLRYRGLGLADVEAVLQARAK